jgi:GT2 family glycosyltransferase
VPAVSIVISTSNRGPLFQKTVRQVLEQPFQDFELILIDQSDSPHAEANQAYIEGRADNRVTYIRIKRKGLPNARNEGIRKVRADVVLFLDDDVILLRDDFIAAHLAAYEDPTVGGVTGRHVERSLRTNSRRTACHVSWNGRTVYNLFGAKRVPIRTCKGSNMSFRTAVFANVGGFDRRCEMLEDADFSTRVARAGWRLVFEPDAELLHLSAPSGGVRPPDAIGVEHRRFRSTSYFVLKHRGAAGFVPFLATFGVIAIKRAVQFRSAAALPALFRAVLIGLERWRLGPDQELVI